jgi:peptidoglycan/xylan/chitin deacetylase (PgdA/CDA1 family)
LASVVNRSERRPNYPLRRAVVGGVALTLVVLLVVGIVVLRNGNRAAPGAKSAGPNSAVSPAGASTTEPAPAQIGLSPEDLADVRPNEVGHILVLEYHLVEPGVNSEYSRTPESFRADLDWLVEHNFFPIRFRDLTSGRIDVPAGKSPVVLTFDDSSIGQFRFLDDGTIDPMSAMGIMLDVAEKHPEFPAVGTFFPLIEVDVDSRILWGQPDRVGDKLRTIIEAGGEIGSHTVSHERLDRVDADRVQWQLAMSSAILRDLVGEATGEPYEIVSLALPLGMYPTDETLLRSGASEGQSYEFSGAAEVAGGLTVSPFASVFDRFRVNRAQAIDGYLDRIFERLTDDRDLVFVSDGDPDVITVPSEATLDDQQRGTFAVPTGWADEMVVRYRRE